MLLALARNGDKVLNESLVTAASVSLVVASILWIVMSRVILKNLRKRSPLPTASIKVPERDIWKDPPPAPR